MYTFESSIKRFGESPTLVKCYKWLDINTILRYHILQNYISEEIPKKGGIIIENDSLKNRGIQRVIVDFLNLGNDIVLTYDIHSKKEITTTKVPYINGKTLDDLPLEGEEIDTDYIKVYICDYIRYLIQTKTGMKLISFENAVSYKMGMYAIVPEEEIKNICYDIMVHRSPEISPVNIKIITFENGELRLLVTDIGACIQRIVTDNKEMIDMIIKNQELKKKELK